MKSIGVCETLATYYITNVLNIQWFNLYIWFIAGVLGSNVLG